ncbi:hypothetical protein AMAG_11494 [Allomyces macrogynus ATCC 38327]|uniref:Uncharacterized protein n=1 Tax=Allomyces macrogynus (strain ATCC 38327) TaxID=578462 RepID=A0A0L0SV57_ALLM3|nr:hypothetical protein AMAG_11494 [Allomyces macrogynus ATCC 38327]|eukprot:KNE66351.1 hypothetical protein AMAG_11494 [Allomyces macrogynus ATCC 38327]
MATLPMMLYDTWSTAASVPLARAAGDSSTDIPAPASATSSIPRALARTVSWGSSGEFLPPPGTKPPVFPRTESLARPSGVPTVINVPPAALLSHLRRTSVLHSDVGSVRTVATAPAGWPVGTTAPGAFQVPQASARRVSATEPYDATRAVDRSRDHASPRPPDPGPQDMDVLAQVRASQAALLTLASQSAALSASSLATPRPTSSSPLATTPPWVMPHPLTDPQARPISSTSTRPLSASARAVSTRATAAADPADDSDTSSDETADGFSVRLHHAWHVLLLQLVVCGYAIAIGMMLLTTYGGVDPYWINDPWYQQQQHTRARTRMLGIPLTVFATWSLFTGWWIVVGLVVVGAGAPAWAIWTWVGIQWVNSVVLVVATLGLPGTSYVVLQFAGIALVMVAMHFWSMYAWWVGRQPGARDGRHGHRRRRSRHSSDDDDVEAAK